MKTVLFTAALIISLASCNTRESFEVRVNRGDVVTTKVIQVNPKDREVFSSLAGCPNGSEVYYLGFDDDKNGNLDSYEVYHSYQICK